MHYVATGNTNSAIGEEVIALQHSQSAIVTYKAAVICVHMYMYINCIRTYEQVTHLMLLHVCAQLGNWHGVQFSQTTAHNNF